jgi:hypothetical protein
MKVIENGIEYEVIKNIYRDKFWYLNDLYHRENGPAIDYSDGYKAWFKHGKYHREDGPAVIFSDGTEEYGLNGKLYINIKSNEQWIEFQKELIIKEIIE